MEQTELISANAEEINQMIASRIRNIRKRQGLTQTELSDLSGVSVGSVKRFERTGKISLSSFTKLLLVLGMQTELESLFQNLWGAGFRKRTPEQRNMRNRTDAFIKQTGNHIDVVK